MKLPRRRDRRDAGFLCSATWRGAPRGVRRLPEMRMPQLENRLRQLTGRDRGAPDIAISGSAI